MKLLFVFVVIALISESFGEANQQEVIVEGKKNCAANSNKLNCNSQCGLCMKYCFAPNIRKASSDCTRGTCCVLVRKDVTLSEYKIDSLQENGERKQHLDSKNNL